MEIQQNIDVDLYRVSQTSSGKIKLERGTNELEPITGGNIFQPPPEEGEALSTILKSLNDRFGTDFADDDKVFIQQLEEKLAGEPPFQARFGVPSNQVPVVTLPHQGDSLQDLGCTKTGCRVFS